MTSARIFWPLVLTAVLAACSGNLGGGQSTLPGMPQGGTNVQQITPPGPTSTPVSASNVVSVGDSVAPQALPPIMGWGGSIAFAKPTAAPNPKATGSPGDAPSAPPVSIGITAGVVEPADTPHFGSASAKKHAKRDPNAVTALLFISLLATSNVTLPEYPKIAIDMPRDIAAKHHDDTFALALYDPQSKEKSYRLAVAERDLSSPLPGSMPSPVSSAYATPIPTATPFGMANGPTAFTPPPVGSEIGGDALPPEYVAFQPTASALSLKANQPLVFALYAIPPQPSPSPSAVPTGGASAAPTTSPGAIASPTAGTSPSPSPHPAASVAALSTATNR